MRNSLYQYNAETCRYECVRVKSADVVFYMSGVIILATGFLAGMLTLHDYVFDSEKEIALRKENLALAGNQAILTSQLNTIEATLTALEQEDKKLHTKFFGSAPASISKDQVTPVEKHVLLASPSDFRETIKKVKARAVKLLSASTSANTHHGKAFSLKAKDVGIISTMPLLQPVYPWKPENVISGFGMRVNPFHKGLYQHPGVDIAAPRGTAVIATASGTVVEIKKSMVQAGYGNYIDIDHGNGIITRYAHLEDIRVKYKQKVSKGLIIGTTGNSGGSVAPHLHYEVMRNGATVDPVEFMIRGLSSNEYHQLRMISQKQNQSLD